MKKVFTLLFALGSFVLVQAQPGNRDNRGFDQGNDQRNNQRNDQQNNQDEFDRGYDRGKFITDNDRYFDRDSRFNDGRFMERKMQMRINMINQDYNYKIERVRRNFFMSWFEKQRQIRMLENQRRWEISMVQAKFNGYRFDDHDRGYGRNDRDGRSDGRH